MAIYLIDGNAYVYRAYYAIKGLTDSKGRPTNAVFGFTNMLLKILKERKPEGIAVVFDSPGPTHRHAIFEEYKAHRPETPDEIRSQNPLVRLVIEAFNINIFQMPGYEADDILATIARRAKDDGHEVFIVSGDKDMLQLVDDYVKVYDPMKNIVLDEGHVTEKFGVPPRRVTEYMALAGDSADNIPGVKGIGEKTAKELLQQFSSIDELIADSGKIKKERIGRLITENIEMIKLSKQLAEIDRNVPIDVDVEDLAVKEPNWPRLAELFREFEFTSFIKLIPKSSASVSETTIIHDAHALAETIKHIKHSVVFGFDFTAEGVSGVYLKPEGETCAYVPAGEGISEDILFGKLAPLLENPDIEKITHELKSQLPILIDKGVGLGGRVFDAMIAAYLVNPQKSEYGLDGLAFEELGMSVKTEGQGCLKAEIIAGLRTRLGDELRGKGMERLFEEIEMPLVEVLVSMERRGIALDSDMLNDISKELERQLDVITNRIYFIAGSEFNINSPKQLGHILFGVLGLQPGKKKKTGFSTEVSVLEELAKVHELPAEILNYRTLSKLKSTYVDALPPLVDPEDGRLHTTFTQTVAATGRLSSIEPNLQNIPVRGEWGDRIREAFIAPKGSIIITSDYSQIELRILAHLSKDPVLISAFKEGADIHTATAGDIFGVSAESVTPAMRRTAKTVVFGVIYGISSFGLSESLGVSRFHAEKYIERFFDRHPGVKGYIDRTIEEATSKGYVTTLFGRVRPIPELRNKNGNIRQFGERLAVNSPIQGTAADVIKIAMINVHRRFLEEGLSSGLILQVHDELLVESPEAEKHEAMKILRHEMENACVLDAPLKVGMGFGKNWTEAAH